MSKNYIFLAMLCCLTCNIAAQNTILSEDFESGAETTEGGDYATLVDPNMPDGWEVKSTYEGNKANYRWHNYFSVKGTIGGRHVASCDAAMFDEEDHPSAYGPKEETLLTPELDLNDTYQLSFDWKAASASALENKEYDFQVRVVVDNNMEAAETIWSFQDAAMLKQSGVTVFPWTGWTVYKSAVDLSKWKGQKVKIAFVHKMLKKKANIVYLDNVVVKQYTPITAPKPQCNPNFYNFGQVPIGAKKYSEIITLKNIGANGLQIEDVVTSSSDYTTNIKKEEVKLDKNDTYEFNIIYTPTLTGTAKGTVTLKTNGGDFVINVSATKQLLPAGYSYEGFENSVPPTGWTTNGKSWSQTNYALEGDYSAYSSGDIMGTPCELVSPRLDLSTGTHAITFTYFDSFEGEDEVPYPDSEVTLQLSKDGGKTWTVLFTNETYNAVVVKEVSLGAPASDNCYLKWVYKNPSAAMDEGVSLSIFYLDIVVLPPMYGKEGTPGAATLIAPANNATDIYNKEVLLQWESTLFADSYKLYVGKTEAANDVINGENVAGTSYTIAKCDYNTTYYWKVVPYNSKGEATDVPTWSFKTIADQSVSTYPWSETFESKVFPPLGWRMVKDGYTRWETSNYGAFDGTYSAYASCGNNYQESTLETPEFVLPADEAVQISFYWGNAVPISLLIDESGLIQNTTTQADAIDACYFEIFAEGEWQTLKILSDKKNKYWVRDRIALDAYKGKTVAFRWRYAGLDYYESTGVSLDNVTIELTATEKASFNAEKWDAGKVNATQKVESGNIFTILNDGKKDLVVQSVQFADAGLKSSLTAGTKIAVGNGVAFSLSLTPTEADKTIEDKMTVTFEGGYSVAFPVSAIVLPTDVMYYNFEADEFGSLQPNGFTTIDVDRKATINMSMLDYPHYGEAFAFMVMNGKKADWRNIKALSGDQNLVAFGADADRTDVEDWIVSTAMTATDQSQFRFFARNYESKDQTGQSFSASKVSVLVSTTSATDRSTFTEEMSQTLPYFEGQYSEYTVDLSKYAGKTVYIALRHTVNDGLAAFFDDFYFEHFSSFSVGMKSERINGKITVYPNPVADIAYLDGIEENADITVTSASGAVVLKQDNVNQIDLSGLSAGFYILTVKCADKVETIRVIKR